MMAGTLREHLQGIYDQYGKLTPALVVSEASDPAHPLHDKFEWDDSVAGQRYRERQASGLIRSVRVVYAEATDDEPERTTRAYHSTLDEDSKPVYRPAEELALDPMARQLLLRQMRRDWLAFRRRWEGFTEFAEMVTTDLNIAPPEAQAS